MEKLLLAFMSVALSGSCYAQELTLMCKGWIPIYQDNSWKSQSAPATNDTLLIKLNKTSNTATFLSQIGEVAITIKSNNDFYYGSSPVGKMILGRYVAQINLSINRLDGDTNISYGFDDKNIGNTLFTGACTPAKPMF